MFRPLVVLLAGILACSESPVLAPPASESESPRVPTAPATLVANYALVLVNGTSLPSESPTGAGQWDYDGARVELEMAQLAFYNDGTFEESWFHRHILNGRSTSLTQTCKSRYTRISDSTLQIGIGDAATVMTLTANGLIWQLPGFTLTYELQK